MTSLHDQNEGIEQQNEKYGCSSGVVPVVAPSSVKYVIGGVTVHFPVRAYPSQVAIMDKVIRGITHARNCLLESPTGTGKTLALLCSSLAWQRKEEERVAELKIQVETSSDMECMQVNCVPNPDRYTFMEDDYDFRERDCDDFDDDFECPPHKTRTIHTGRKKPGLNSRNDPAIKNGGEGSKQTADKESICFSNVVIPRVPRIYYATRTHKQIEQVVRELKKTEYKNAKMTILSSREHSCIRDNVKGYHSKTELCRELLDPINGPGCYFHTNVKNLACHASLESVGFETPWDIEDLVKLGRSKKTCPYFVARSLMSSAKLIFCPYNYLIDPLIRESMQLDVRGEVIILDEAHNIEDSSRDAASFSVVQDDLQLAINDIKSVMLAGTLPTVHQHMGEFLEQLSEFINSQKDSVVFSDYDEGHCALTGTMAIGHLSLLNVGPKEYPAFKNAVGACVAELKNPEIDKSGKPVNHHVISAATRCILEGLVLIFDFLYDDSLRYCDDYRVVIMKSMSRNSSGFQNKKKMHSSEWKYTLHFWCQNPAVVFHELQASARSIILTSGTLAPVDSFQSELGTTFHIQLQTTHVIPTSQLWVGSVPCGPRGNDLCATYGNTQTHGFQDELGSLVLSVCRKVPFGVVCFLPSYRLLDKLAERWQATGLWCDLESVKTVLTEPRRSDELDAVMRDFHQSIRDHEAAGRDGDGLQTGSLLFAVFRGKVSEGFDFADNYARAIVAVGIPFLNSKNIQVNLKKAHNSQNWSKRGLLDGNKWYQIQAYRALNQALGRCIRHRNDWGAILLVDSRFRGNLSHVGQLSKWLKNYMQQYPDWLSMYQSLSDFMIHRSAAKLENVVI
ncbi:Fanconi anemia group J protein homolog [Bacillus rossius redtenbacheri]|uniref:Fanconi anemia group J protein homolog n=1 Tax=Bacillus rossius redtenbacheri TaxID=93214 RepID=UPI002FDE93A2